MPTMFEIDAYVEVGGLASFRFNWDNQNQRAAAQIDKVLPRREARADPVRVADRQEFVLNRKTARALGLAVPQALLLRADTSSSNAASRRPGAQAALRLLRDRSTPSCFSLRYR